MNLGENIYNNRTRCHLSQGDLADALEVSRQSISKWENNASVPELDKLIRLSDIFEITLDELVFAGDRGTRVQTEQPVPTITTIHHHPDYTHFKGTAVGLILLTAGLLGFVLAVFWGPQLRVGEQIGEMISILVAIAGAMFLAPHSFRVFSIYAVSVFMYLLVSFGLLNVKTYNNMYFIIALGLMIWIWFFILLSHANKGCDDHDNDQSPVGTTG